MSLPTITLPWKNGETVHLTQGNRDHNTIVYFKTEMVPLLKHEKVSNAAHLAKLFLKVFYAANSNNKIFDKDGKEAKTEKEQVKIIQTFINNDKRDKKKRKVHHNDNEVHLPDDTNPVSVVSNNTAAASNFTNNNNFNSLATGGGMDTGGLQSKKVQHRDNKFSAPTTGMHLSSHLFVPSVVSNTTAASNNFTAGTELSISFPTDEDNGMSEMVHHQQYQQRESPTSATADLVAAAAVSTAPGFSPPSDKQNHQPQSNPPQFQQPPSPHKSVHSVDGMDGFLEALDNDRNMDNIVQEMSAMRLDLQEMKEMKVEFGEMKVEFVEMKAKVGELEAKMEENSKLLEYFCSKDKKEE